MIKGQLISKADFNIFIWIKAQQSYFCISALALKKPLKVIHPILEARAEIKNIFVGPLVQMRILKNDFEINWHLTFPWFIVQVCNDPVVLGKFGAGSLAQSSNLNAYQNGVK